jgi:excisionase family DNA binding protein
MPAINPEVNATEPPGHSHRVAVDHEFLTKREAAELLRVSERIIMQYVRRGALAAYCAKTGSRLRFKRTDVLHVLESIPR